MCHTPKVSIIIPAYNASDYLAEAIDSALSQTYDNMEVLVVNDGSKDDGATRKIAQSYGAKIRYFEKENGGVSSALNYGIKHMTGEYFSWLSHDDLYLENKVQMQMMKLNECGDNIVVYCGSNTIDKDSKLVKEGALNYPTGTLDPIEALVYVTKNGMGGCAFLIPKIAFEQAGLFDENLRYCQDIFMWWKIFLAGFSLVFCNEVGVLSRVHANQLTQTGSSLYHHDAQYIGEQIAEEFTRISTKKRNVLYLYAKEEAKHNNPGVVALCIQLGKNRILSYRNIVTIRFMQVYGMVRPLIRKMYYLIFRGIKTK